MHYHHESVWSVSNFNVLGLDSDLIFGIERILYAGMVVEGWNHTGIQGDKNGVLKMQPIEGLLN